MTDDTALPPPARAAILRAAVGIGVYAGALGTSFGAVSIGSGLSVGQTMLLSLVMFSGASQFAFVGVAAAGSPLAAIPAALLLGVRNAFYGVTLSEILNPRGWQRLWTAHFVIDETTAMAVAQSGRERQRYAFWVTGLILCACWQIGTLVGALVGTAIDPVALGLDAAAPAVFLALLWPALNQVGESLGRPHRSHPGPDPAADRTARGARHRRGRRGPRRGPASPPPQARS